MAGCDYVLLWFGLRFAIVTMVLVVEGVDGRIVFSR